MQRTRATIWQRLQLAAIFTLATALGCSSSFNPAQQYPAWAYDAPVYYKPTLDVERNELPGNHPDDAKHYFTQDRVVMVRRPGGHNPGHVPRIAVYVTKTNGYHWELAGYFGIEQTHFPLVVDGDGDYGIRFVGPGQPVAKTNPPMPMRVYHVDNEKPQVSVFIEPADTYYQPNQEVTLHWDAADPNLLEQPVKITMLMNVTADKPMAVDLDRTFDKQGSLKIVVPEDAINGGLKLKVTADDRAGNQGYAWSQHMQVMPADEPMAIGAPATPPAEPEQIAPTVQPADEYPSLESESVREMTIESAPEEVVVPDVSSGTDSTIDSGTPDSSSDVNGPSEPWQVEPDQTPPEPDMAPELQETPGEWNNQPAAPEGGTLNESGTLESPEGGSENGSGRMVGGAAPGGTLGPISSPSSRAQPADPLPLAPMSLNGAGRTITRPQHVLSTHAAPGVWRLPPTDRTNPTARSSALP